MINFDDIMKLYPIDKLTTEEADAIAWTILEELKKNNDTEGLKDFSELINKELKRRGLSLD